MCGWPHRFSHYWTGSQSHLASTGCVWWLRPVGIDWWEVDNETIAASFTMFHQQYTWMKGFRFRLWQGHLGWLCSVATVESSPCESFVSLLAKPISDGLLSSTVLQTCPLGLFAQEVSGWLQWRRIYTGTSCETHPSCSETGPCVRLIFPQR